MEKNLGGVVLFGSSFKSDLIYILQYKKIFNLAFFMSSNETIQGRFCRELYSTDPGTNQEKFGFDTYDKSGSLHLFSRN